MNTEEKTGRGLKWPVCSLLLLMGLGALGYWTYSKYLEEQAIVATRQSAPPPAISGVAQDGPVEQKNVSYRSGLPPALLIGFAVLMIAILGTILYLWWSLKDWEGGKKYGEPEEPRAE